MQPTCVICACELPKHRRLTCSNECYKKYRNTYNREYASTRNMTKGTPVHQAKRTGTPIETDADQARIKREIDLKHGIGCGPCRSLKGTPEWDEAVKTATPPHMIRKVSILFGMGSGSKASVSTRDNRNERYIRA